MIKYIIYHRREHPSNLRPPSHQSHKLWKSCLRKVIKFLLRTCDNYNSDYILNYYHTYSSIICSLDDAVGDESVAEENEDDEEYLNARD